MATTPYEALEEVEKQANYVTHVWRGGIRHKPPREWSPVIGDCLNNLRSSLDQIAWGLAEGRGDRFTAFPIFRDENDYRRVAPERHLKQVRQDAHDIIQSFQPYLHVKGPEAHFLSLLDRLTNEDKHRELLGTEVGVAHIFVDAPAGPIAVGDELIFEFEPRQGWFADQAVFARYRTSNPAVYVPLRFTFDVAFDPAGSAQGQPILTCLASLMVTVYFVLATIEQRFFVTEIAEMIRPPLEGRATFIGTD